MTQPSAPAVFSTIALIGKYHSAESAHTVAELAVWLAERGGAPLIETDTAREAGLDQFPSAHLPEIGSVADLAIVVGGDGTLLRAARALASSGVPLVGVNQGRLGFMTDISRRDMAMSLAQILEGKYRADTRLMLEVSVLRDDAVVMQGLALNEVVVSKSDGGRMIEFELTIDGEFIYNQRSDGLIVSTATGSTAYALSANGPILHPGVSGIALVPLCPHALSNRPITVPVDVKIGISPAPGNDACVHCDGQTRFDLIAGDRVLITRSPHDLSLLHPESYSYFAMLREKLRWSEPTHPSR